MFLFIFPIFFHLLFNFAKQFSNVKVKVERERWGENVCFFQTFTFNFYL